MTLHKRHGLFKEFHRQNSLPGCLNCNIIGPHQVESQLSTIRQREWKSEKGPHTRSLSQFNTTKRIGKKKVRWKHCWNFQSHFLLQAV
uniref:Uncharacterized protein n=1 Tax=Rhizophora mucronata TaxID=61149 RepID=A0A2P2N6T5_RHIMU